MATLERIRKRSGLLIVVIGFAMMAFILTDLLGSGGSLFNDYNTIGKIDGNKIGRDVFAMKMDELIKSNPQYAQFTSKQQADAVWNQILREQLLGEQYDELGMLVTAEELRYDLLNNPQVQQIQLFMDQSGQFTEAAFTEGLRVLNERKDSDPQFREFYVQWVAFEKSVKEQSLMMKYNTAIEKGLYTPKALARAEHIAGSKQVNVSFIQMPYAAISDSTIEVTESEKKAYYKANKNKFKQEAVRNIEYINFAIAPSAKDRAEIEAELKEMMVDRIAFNTSMNQNDTVVGFANADNDSAFAAQFSEQPIDMGFKTKGMLPPVLDTVVFDAPIGTVYGPYEDAGGFKLSKLTAVKFLPDSVKARHILIGYQGAERSSATRAPQEAKALADSLFEIIKADKNAFEGISAVYNDDVVAQGKGGDLGYFQQGQMATEFNNYCFYNATGDVGLVITNFGFHIINITDQKGSNKSVKVATIHRNVLSSDETIKEAYSQASSFASEAQRAEDFRALAEEKGLQLLPATNIKEFDEQVPGLGMSRKIVQWAWNEDREEGAIGLIDNNLQSYVVVVLTDILEEGYTPMEKVDEVVTLGARNVKKGEKLVADLKAAAEGKTDINAIAAALNTTVKTQSINRKSAALVGSGNEPKVIGRMLAAPTNTLSEAMAGENAAYIYIVTGINDAFDKPDYKEDMTVMNQDMRARAAGSVFESIRKGVKIEDKRALFY
jgi:hypothetical protein